MAYNPFDISSQYINASQYKTLDIAVSAAISGGYGLNIDTHWLSVPTQSIAVKELVFSGGSIQPSNGATVTIDSPVIAGITQIFDSSLGGLIRGTIITDAIYPEWWGNSANNIQLAVDNVIASTIATRQIFLSGNSYTITSPVSLIGNQHPQIIGSGLFGTTVNFSTTPEQAAFSVVGTEQQSGGCLKNLIIQDPTNTVSTSGLIGLSMSGVVGFTFDIQVQTGKRGVLWSNGVNTFTEYCQGILRTTTTVATGCEYRSAGNASFHGSGLLLGSVLNFDCTNGNAILIGTSCVPYDAPMDSSIFSFGTGDAVAIHNLSAVTLWFKGIMGIERFNTGNFTWADSNQVFLLGDVGFLGDETKANMGTLFLAAQINDSKAGSSIGILKPINRLTLTSTNTASFSPFALIGSQFDVLVDAAGTGYHYILRGTLINDESSGYAWTLQDTLLSVNTAGYGTPTVSVSGTTVTVSGSWGGNPITVGMTFNQIGQSYAHHDN